MKMSIAGRAFACAVSALSLVAACGAPAQTPAAIDVSHVEASHTQSALPANWNKDAAFYEIFVRSFKDSDGDGVGDFKGLTSRLDYLQGLGVTGIWLMPMMPSEDHDHGYAVNDYRAVNPDYGTMADFETFVQEAHKRGIGIILDFVINHSGSGNAIFRDAAASKSSPYRDWFVFSDKNPGWYDAKNRGQDGRFWNDPWLPADKTVPGGHGLYYGVFSRQMPDWNLRNPKVVAYIQDSMRFWMNKGVDGFRFDAVTMLIEDGPRSYFNNPKNPAVVAQLNDVVQSYDNRYLVCEASEGAEMYMNACNAFAYGTQDFIKDSARKGALADGLVKQLQSPNRDKMPLALQSHDSYVGDRLINQFGVGDQADYEVSAAISILASRTPFSYYGEEIGMSNGGVYNDPGIRSPMSWTGERHTAGFTTGKPYRAPAINVASMNVAEEAGDPSSLLEYYRALYNVRRDHPVIGAGEMKLQSKSGDSSLVFTRSDASDTAAVLINLTAQPLSISVDTGAANSSFTQALLKTGDSAGAPVASGGDGRISVVVPAKSAAVYVRTK